MRTRPACIHAAARLRTLGIACAVMATCAGACTSSKPKPIGDTTVFGSAGSAGAESDAGSASAFGTDCPNAAPSSVPAQSPRILILGPAYPSATSIATHLQGMLNGDSTFQSPQVVGQSIDQLTDAATISQGSSLMYYFYNPDSRESRLAALSSAWSYVVLLEQTKFATKYPEFYFEGVRALGCSARAAGAKPVVLMTWSDGQDTSARGEVTYRVANGASSIVSPAGYAWDALRPDGGLAAGKDLFVAAATLYSTLTGRSAASTGYHPAGLSSDLATQMADKALEVVTAEKGKVHYQGAYSGVVQMQTMAAGGAFWSLDWGTSSEVEWDGKMSSILPKAGFTPHITHLGAPQGQQTCDSAFLTAATPDLNKQQYQLLYARDYSLDAATIRSTGAQTDLQLQVWDRHADNIPADGQAAVGMMEYILTTKYDQAKTLGLALTPYHVMFSKLKTMRPSVQLTKDGTHATDTVAYGQAIMSVVSRTGVKVATTGLDADTKLSAVLADETIRQLSSLSASGTPVADDPSSRPTAP